MTETPARTPAPEDSAKMVVILREQEESFAELLEATKVEVEARLLLRLREEMEAQAAAYAEELDAAADAQAVYTFVGWMLVIGALSLVAVQRRKLKSASLYDRRSKA